MIADCYALGAFGMWLALTLKKPALAPALTILFVLLLPSVLCGSISSPTSSSSCGA